MKQKRQNQRFITLAFTVPTPRAWVSGVSRQEGHYAWPREVIIKRKPSLYFHHHATVERVVC
jgi:hypothetical protein